MDQTIQTTKQVKVPHAYFRKAKSEYADWRWTMVREFVQNSYDAQAERIDFEVALNVAGQLELRVEDDGSGMDRDTLENVLLCLGGSLKPSGAIGGFGYAKAILFFAHRSYAIRTQDLLVEGEGGQYRLTEGHSQVKGTQIRVVLEDHPDLAQAWRDCIISYAAACFMEYATGRPVAIALDGQDLCQNNDRTYDVLLRSALGDIWYDEVQDSNRSVFIVSVQGLPMLSEAVYSDTNQTALHGGIELEAGSAALTANRDGFRSAWREKFSEIVGSMVQDHSAARFGHSLDIAINVDARKESVDDQMESGHSDSVGEPMSGPLLLLAATAGQDELARYAAALGRIEQGSYPPNFHLRVASISSRRTARSEAYVTTSDVVAELNRQRTRRLAHLWRTAVSTVLCCQWALEHGAVFQDAEGRLVEQGASHGDLSALQLFHHDRPVDVGFCFIANTEGLCASPVSGDGPHRIYINPLLLTREVRFRALDALDIAFHEVAHLWEQHHGEAFCGVEANLRQSVRRWLTERELLVRLASMSAPSHSRPAGA